MLNAKVKKLLKHGAEVSPYIPETTKDGKLIIDLRLKQTENLYSKFSIGADKYIDSTVGEYLRKRFKQVPLKKEAVIKIHLDNEEPPINKREATVSLKNYAYLKYASSKKYANRYLFLGIGLAILSIVFIAFILGFKLRDINDSVRLVTDIFLWLFVWESFIVIVINYPEERKTYLIYANMYVSKIEYVVDEITNSKPLKIVENATKTVAEAAGTILEAMEEAAHATKQASKQLKTATKNQNTQNDKQ